MLLIGSCYLEAESLAKPSDLLEKGTESTSAQESRTCPPCVGASVLAWPLHLPIRGTYSHGAEASAAVLGQLLLLKKCPLVVQQVQCQCHRRSQCLLSTIFSIPRGSRRFLTFSSFPPEPYPGLQQKESCWVDALSNMSEYVILVNLCLIVQVLPR